MPGTYEPYSQLAPPAQRGMDYMAWHGVGNWAGTNPHARCMGLSVSMDLRASLVIAQTFHRQYHGIVHLRSHMNTVLIRYHSKLYA